MILHIDMDAFFASIEQAINPRLKGRPLIVGSRPDKLHTVVCAASYEAKALGIDSGMPSAVAFKLCPGLKFVPAQQAKYIWTSEQILQMLRNSGFEVIYASIDEFQIDIASQDTAEKTAKEIKQQIQNRFNISASIGIAKNCILAKLASKLQKPDGLTIINENNLQDILNKTAVDKLCGIGISTTKILHNLGIKTCLDLYNKTPHYLHRCLGKNGLNLYISLHSSDSFEKINQEKEGPKSIGHSYTLGFSSKNPYFIKAWIRLLSDMVAFRLRQNCMNAYTVSLWLSCPERPGFSAQKTFKQPTDDGYEIYSRCLKIMAKLGPKMPKIRAIGLSCSCLTSEKYSFLFKEQIKRESLIKSIDKINNRFGDGTVYPAIIEIAKSTDQISLSRIR